MYEAVLPLSPHVPRRRGAYTDGMIKISALFVVILCAGSALAGGGARRSAATGPQAAAVKALASGFRGLPPGAAGIKQWALIKGVLNQGGLEKPAAWNEIRAYAMARAKELGAGLKEANVDALREADYMTRFLHQNFSQAMEKEHADYLADLRKEVNSGNASLLHMRMEAMALQLAIKMHQEEGVRAAEALTGEASVPQGDQGYWTPREVLKQGSLASAVFALATAYGQLAPEADGTKDLVSIAGMAREVQDRAALWPHVRRAFLARIPALSGRIASKTDALGAAIESFELATFLDNAFGAAMSEEDAVAMRAVKASGGEMLRQLEALSAKEKEAAIEAAAAQDRAAQRKTRAARFEVYKTWLRNAKPGDRVRVAGEMRDLALEDKGDESLQIEVRNHLLETIAGEDYEHDASIAKIMGHLARRADSEILKETTISLLMSRAGYSKSRYFADVAGVAASEIAMDVGASAKVKASAVAYFAQELRLFPAKAEQKRAGARLETIIGSARGSRLALEIPEQNGIHPADAPRSWGPWKAGWEMLRDMLAKAEAPVPVILGLLVPSVFAMSAGMSGFLPGVVAGVVALLMSAAVLRGGWHGHPGMGLLHALTTAATAAVFALIAPAFGLFAVLALAAALAAQVFLTRESMDYGVPRLGLVAHGIVMAFAAAALAAARAFGWL